LAAISLATVPVTPRHLSSLILNLQILQKVMKFAKQEYADLLYGETRGNSRPAR
jgi:hypothetical protein